MLRYEVTHPVVNDAGMTLWRQLGVSSWPTLAVVSPGGRLIAMVAGEGHRQDIDDIVAAALEVRGVGGMGAVGVELQAFLRMFLAALRTAPACPVWDCFRNCPC